METVEEILENVCMSEIQKLERLSELLVRKMDTGRINIKIDSIFNIITEDNELKCDVLRKAFTVSDNFEENVEFFINYFKTFSYFENYKLLAKLVIFFCEVLDDRKHILYDILYQLDVENTNKVLLNYVFSKKDYKECNIIFKTYLKHLSIISQSMFLNSLYEYSKSHRTLTFFYIGLKNIDEAALTHETSIIQSKDFWIFLSDLLVDSQSDLETKTTIYLIVILIDLIKNEKIKLTFLNADGEETAWNAFFALLQIFSSQKPEFFKSSFNLLSCLSSLHYFWQHYVYRLLLKSVPFHLKCTVLTKILKQKIKIEYANLRSFLKMILSEINEQRCCNNDCPVFKELHHFCETMSVQDFSLVLDEMFLIRWNSEQICKIMRTLLVDSKKNMVDLKYFTRTANFMKQFDPSCFSSVELDQKITTFFYKPNNFGFWWRLVGYDIPLSTSDLDKGKFEDLALPKLLELSKKKSDDLREIQVYVILLKEFTSCINLMKQYPLSINVRMIMYKQFFDRGPKIAKASLDWRETSEIFCEYLMNNLSENTYVTYIKMLKGYLEFQKGWWNCPVKCSFKRILKNPKVYTKFQIYFAEELARYIELNAYDERILYKNIAEKWKPLILDTKDVELCTGGLYIVLNKCNLGDKENKSIVRKLLKKHHCDKVTEELYTHYIKADMVKLSFRHLCKIRKYKKFKIISKLFCEIIFSESCLYSDQICLESEYIKFCFSSSKNIKYSMDKLHSTYCQDSRTIRTEDQQRILDIVTKIYLHPLSDAVCRIKCLSILKRQVQRISDAASMDYESFVKLILNKFKEILDISMKDNVTKLRIVQVFFFVRRLLNKATTNKEQLQKYLKEIALEILTKEWSSENKVVKQITQLMFITLSYTETFFEEYKCLVDRTEEQPHLADSFLPILCHLAPRCDFSGIKGSKMEDLLASVFLLSNNSDDKLRLYGKILLKLICDHFNEDSEHKNTALKYKFAVEQIEMEIQSNHEKVVDILKTDYIFLKVLDPQRDNWMETVLYILPKLNQVNASEWKDTKSYLSESKAVGNNKIKGPVVLNDAVNLFIETNGKYINYSTQDILNIFKVPLSGPEFKEFR